MIYEIDEKETFEHLKIQHDQVETLFTLRAEQRKILRETCSSILNIEYGILDNCINSFEYSLLISCYTFSEQLLKNSIYQLLTKDSNDNGHVDTFINKKLDSNKFSPSPKYCELKKELNSFQKFDFYISQYNPIIKSYDEMITSRHSYAHANSYKYNFESFPDVIRALEYLMFEYNLFLQRYEDKKNNITYWNNFIDCLKKIKRVDQCDIQKEDSMFVDLIENVKLFQDDCSNKDIGIEKVSIFLEVFSLLDELLENKGNKEYSFNTVNNLKNELIFSKK